ncbi:MAG TPA: DUF4236 domain-containing protein [Propionibacteriaceae bacterium]|nr:DUF4236 domain-containing protein [Propionibacteriaceae bacterium]
MGFRIRRSFAVMPGVRVNLSPSSIGLTVGGRYARTTVNSRTGVRRSYSIPGTGISYTSRPTQAPARTRGTVRVTPPQQAAEHALAPAPGLFAARGEKELYAALTQGRYADLEGIASRHHEVRMTCMLVDGFHTPDTPETYRRLRGMFEELWSSGYDPQHDGFLTTYAWASTATIGLAPGISVTLPLHRAAIGLALAELRQENGDLVEAADLVETLEPSAPAAVSLAELYGLLERWPAVVQLTEQVSGRDELSTFLLIQRAAALRELDHYVAAREVLRPVLARRSVPPELRHLALLQRGLAYAAEGKRGQARRDLERILAEDGRFPGLAEALAELR